jgi:hypothetical protein
MVATSSEYDICLSRDGWSLPRETRRDSPESQRHSRNGITRWVIVEQPFGASQHGLLRKVVLPVGLLVQSPDQWPNLRYMVRLGQVEPMTPQNPQMAVHIDDPFLGRHTRQLPRVARIRFEIHCEICIESVKG